MSGRSTWGSSGIFRGNSTWESRGLIPASILPKDLKGWLIPSLTLRIRDTSDSCQTTVRTIIAKEASRLRYSAS
ncbi:hypothetical protein SLEP1_g6465 [Rubroshorea leprosula]|uniref:Uncharacterized protein n=1 Tax=Rubroshorea leprosula TaxID=152421 RepID=A0AAV5I1L7_9ROSI|nr:hypothetical protein SLEP1_g6465 [Rubroshorea leprosula]